MKVTLTLDIPVATILRDRIPTAVLANEFGKLKQELVEGMPDGAVVACSLSEVVSTQDGLLYQDSILLGVQAADAAARAAGFQYAEEYVRALEAIELENKEER